MAAAAGDVPAEPGAILRERRGEPIQALLPKSSVERGEALARMASES
jgi:hypothetical protein